MIAREAESQALQLNSSTRHDFQNTSFGDELPSVSCDLADLNISTNDFDQLLLDGLSMDCDGPAQNATAQSYCDFPNMFLEDNQRPRDMNISELTEASLTAFFQSLSSSAQLKETPRGDATPPFSGGSTPQSQSRAVSPTWSESSGNMSGSSMSGPSCPRKLAHSNNLVPRHKRPSHRRAEVKRRDKIKTCLDDIKLQVPSLHDKGKLSESAILFKAAEYIRQLKDGYSERGIKAAELRREIQCLSEEIQSFQETLPASGLKEEAIAHPGLDGLYAEWVAQQSRQSTKHFIFTSITSSLFDSFKRVVGDASSLDSIARRVKEWQTNYLSLPNLRKQITNGLLKLTRNSNVVTFSEDLKVDSCVDGKS